MLKNPSIFSQKLFEPVQSYLIKNKFHRIYRAVPIIRTDNQAYSKEIKQYWKKKLGIYINPVWHHIIAAQTQNYDPRYLKKDIWWTYFHKKLNYSVHHAPLIADKNFLDFYIDKQFLPSTVFKVVKGRFFDEANRLISKERAQAILFEDQSEKFAKPSKLFQGKDACKLKFINGKMFIQGKENTFDQFIQRMGSNFLIQYTIKQHPHIASVHPNSLNTLRIFTIRLDTNVYFLNGAIKFGADNNDADNTGNGVLCGINKENHKLADVAYNRKLETFTNHMNTGIEFGSFGKIPHYQDAIDLCKEVHKNLLYHDFAAWDVAITKDGSPLIIELNSKPSVFLWQIIFKEPFFGELTDEVIEYVLKK